MLRKCSNCGTELEESGMEQINTGRIQYICWDCYKKGHGEAATAEFRRVQRMEKYANYKKRNR